MKRHSYILLLSLAVAAILTAACTGLPGTGQSVPPAPTGDAGPSFAGRWMTTWQGGGHDVPMNLIISRNVVTGTYDYNGGTIVGTVSGDRFIGTWTEDGGVSKGSVEFVMAGDGRSFSGWWAYEGDNLEEAKRGDPTWTGIRA